MPSGWSSRGCRTRGPPGVRTLTEAQAGAVPPVPGAGRGCGDVSRRDLRYLRGAEWPLPSSGVADEHRPRIDSSAAACDAPHAGPARRRTHLGHDRFDHDGPDGPEATDDAFSSPAPIVFGQTENRPRTSKAVFVATLED